MARDDFTKVTKDKLKDNVGSHCSKPDCRVPTMAPSNNIGVAAHICAASKGGPRYDKSMTPEERKSIDNGIWLCQNHAREIDNNPDNYTIELLNTWKKQAEESATSELGIIPPNDTDAINMVTSALTGNPSAFIPNAIHNIHEATKISLEKIDSKFSFKTKFEDGITTIKCLPKEEIILSIKIDEKHNDRLKNLFHYGKSAQLNLNDISMTGSTLFEYLNKEDGILTISKTATSAILKLWLVDNKTGSIELFDDIQSLITFGSKSFQLEGCGFNKFLCINVNSKKITLSPSFEVWDGLNIQSLPYLNKLFSFFSKVHQGWNMFFSIEVDGKKLGEGKEIKLANSEFIDNIYSFFKYINNCRIIASNFKSEIYFLSSIEYTNQEYYTIDKVAKIIEGKEFSTRADFNTNPILNATSKKGMEVEFIKRFTLNQPSSLRITYPEKEIIKIFEESIILPNKVVVFNSITTKIHTTIDEIIGGNQAKIELLLEKDFKYIESYSDLELD